MSNTPTVEDVRRSAFPPPVAPLNVKPSPNRKRPHFERQVTPVDKLWYPERYPFERPNSVPFASRYEHVKVVGKPVDAEPPILPTSFDRHRAHYPRDIEAQKDVAAPILPRVVPFLGQLPDNWQLGVVIGVAIGLVFQLIQTGVNSSLKTGQADILAKLAG